MCVYLKQNIISENKKIFLINMRMRERERETDRERMREKKKRKSNQINLVSLLFPSNLNY